MKKKMLVVSAIAIALTTSSAAFAQSAPEGSLYAPLKTDQESFTPSITDDNVIKDAVTVFARDAYNLKVSVQQLESAKGLGAFQNDAAEQAQADLAYTCNAFPAWLEAQSTVNVAVQTRDALTQLLMASNQDIQSLTLNVNSVADQANSIAADLGALGEKHAADIAAANATMNSMAGDIAQIQSDPTLARYRFAKVSAQSPAKVAYSGVPGLQTGEGYDGLIPLVCDAVRGPKGFNIYSDGSHKAVICSQNFGSASQPVYKWYRGKYPVVNGPVGAVLTQVDDGALSSSGSEFTSYMGMNNGQWQEMRKLLADVRYVPKVQKPGGGYSSSTSGSSSGLSLSGKSSSPAMVPVGALDNALRASGTKNPVAENTGNAANSGKDSYNVIIESDGAVNVKMKGQ